MIEKKIRETKMKMSCPTCNRELTEASVCKCGTDLSLLHHILARADHLFNQAIEAYQTGKNQRALEFQEANLVLVPLDVEARVFQAKLLFKMEHLDDAKEILQTIQAVKPAHPDLSSLCKLLS